MLVRANVNERRVYYRRGSSAPLPSSYVDVELSGWPRTEQPQRRDWKAMSWVTHEPERERCILVYIINDRARSDIGGPPRFGPLGSRVQIRGKIVSPHQSKSLHGDQDYILTYPDERWTVVLWIIRVVFKYLSCLLLNSSAALG